MQNSDKQIYLLYVDDEPSMLDVTKSYLEHKGNFIVDTALSGKEGLEKIPKQEYDAVISDYQMAEMDGVEFLKTVRSKGNNIPFIIFTGRGREEIAIEALNAGADYYLQKGGKPKVQYGELQNFIRQAVERKRADKKNLENEQRMADVINFLPDATFATDTEGRVIAWNKAIEGMTGTPASEMLGKGDYEYAIPFYGSRRPLLTDLVLHEELQNEVSYKVLNCENKDKYYAEVFSPHLHNGDGAYLWFTASPLYDTEGTITGAIESIRDLTEYKQAEGLYKTIFENTGTAMAIIEDEVNISYANDRMKQLLGYSEKDSEFFEHWQERILEEDREKVLQYHRLRRTDQDSTPNSYDFRLIHKKGEILTVNMTAAMIPGTKKNIISFIDITEKTRAEEKLKFTDFTIQNAADAIFWVDFDGRFISVNKKAMKLFGYSEKDFLKHGLSLFMPGFKKEMLHNYWNNKDTGENFTFEIKAPKKDGKYIDVEISVANLNFEGQKYGCAFVRDISERKKSEQALAGSENKFREIFNSTSDIIFLSEFAPETGPGRFIEVNDATCRSLGYSREELLQMSITDILTCETGDKLEDIARQFKSKGKARFEAEAMKKDGTIVSLETSATCFKLNNRLVHLSVGRDITERKKTENTLRALNKKLNILSSVTRHDISNRISILMGFEEMLKEELDFKTASAYLEPMIEATDMIQEQIQFARSYELLGQNSPTWQPIGSIISSVVSNLPVNNIKFKINTGTLQICADNMLEKVFYNLFENAIRHGEHVTEFNVSFSEKEGAGILVIEDNGKGVADDIKKKIFEHGFGNNTGLGLFLTREILDITEICISEAGKEGSGARFEIVVPKDGYRL